MKKSILFISLEGIESASEKNFVTATTYWLESKYESIYNEVKFIGRGTAIKDKRYQDNLETTINEMMECVGSSIDEMVIVYMYDIDIKQPMKNIKKIIKDINSRAESYYNKVVKEYNEEKSFKDSIKIFDHDDLDVAKHYNFEHAINKMKKYTNPKFKELDKTDYKRSFPSKDLLDFYEEILNTVDDKKVKDCKFTKSFYKVWLQIKKEE